MIKIPLDVRELEHPKPLELAMKILRELNETNYLYILHRKNPIPLLDFAGEQGFQCLNKEDTHGNWHILITKNKNIDLQTLLNGSFDV
ncbi:MAG: hypothetical protein COB07_09420 [Sulfurovum sp.]|nr:MAG: hypothetical protein COB07_09420 [Sulfurovum sp.]